MIRRAIFVLTGPKAGGHFLRALPELRQIGLSEAIVLHPLAAHPGPVEPMPNVANWVRHFEATIPKVELALKRGDPARWIIDLARVRAVDLVVISGRPDDLDWVFKSEASPLRTLGARILYLPETQLRNSLLERVVLAVKQPATLERAGPRLREFFGQGELRSIHVSDVPSEVDRDERGGLLLEIITSKQDVAQALLNHSKRRSATLLTILAGEERDGHGGSRGRPLMESLLSASELPILIWPLESGLG